MVTRLFSSGIIKLDHVVNEFRPGDSFVTFHSDTAHWFELLRPFFVRANGRKDPVLYISLTDALLPILTNQKGVKCFHPTHRSNKPKAILRAVYRWVSSQRKNSLVVLDEFSQWKNVLRSSSSVGELSTLLSDLAQKKGLFILSSALRSEFELHDLAHLKDTSTICMEILKEKEGYSLVPLSLKGRYTPFGFTPCYIKHKELERALLTTDTQPRSLTGEENAPVRSLFDNTTDEKYKRMFHEAGEAMVLFTAKGDYREWNEHAAAFFGYSTEELAIIKLTSLVREEDKFALLRTISELRKKRKLVLSCVGVKKNGKRVSLEVRCSEIADGVFLGIIRDVSEQRLFVEQLKEKEEEYKVLLERSPFALFLIHGNKVLYANSHFLTLFRYASFDEIEIKHYKELIAPDSLRQFQKLLRDEHEATSQVLRAQHSDGSAFECMASLTSVQFDKKQCTLVSLVDVSHQQRLLSALTTSEEKYRAIVERSHDAMAVIQDGKFTFVNTACVTLFGFESADQLAGKQHTDVIEQSFREKYATAHTKALTSKVRSTVNECTGLHADGSAFTVEIASVALPQQSAILSYYRDVTEQKTLQQELLSHKKEITLLDKVNASLNSSMDLDQLLMECVEKIMNVLSWDFGAIYLIDEGTKKLSLRFQRNADELFISKLSTLELHEGLGGFVAKTQEPHMYRIEKYPSHLPYRSLFKELSVKSVCFIPLLSSGKFIGLMILGSRKEKSSEQYSASLFKAIMTQAGTAIANSQLYNQIKALEERQRSLIDSLSCAVYSALPNSAITFISPVITQFTGYTPKEFYNNSTLLLTLIHPDDKSGMLERTAHLNDFGERHVIEYRLLPKGKASYIWLRDEMSFLKDEQGNVQQIQGYLTDITRLKESPAEVSDLQVLDSVVLANTEEGIVVYDRDLRCVVWNKAMEKIIGMKEEDVLGKPSATIFPHFEQHHIGQLLQEALNGQPTTSDDIRYYIPGTNKIGYLWGRYSPVRNAEKDIIGVVGIVTDFSKRKEYEAEMHDSEQVLRNVIDTMGDILLITDLKGNVLEVNKSFLRVLGYSRSETIGHEFPYGWLLEEEMGRFVLWIAELRERNWLHDFDMTWRTKDNRLIPMSLSTTLLRNSMGEPVAMLNIARDITERTRLAKDLESRNRQIEMINRIISKANETMDFDEIFHVIAGEINEVIVSDIVNIGILTSDEKSLEIYALKGPQALHRGDTIPIEKTVSRYAIESNAPVVIPDLSADPKYHSLSAFTKGLRSQISFPIVLKGKAFGVLNIGSKEPNFYAETDAQVLQPIAQQIGTIVDRVQLFRQVTEDSAYIHNLLDSINSIVYTVDTQYRLREVNKAWHEFMQDSGVPGIRNYQGVNLFDVLPSELLKQTFRNVVDDIINGSVRFFSQEFIHGTVTGDRIYQLTINPMTIDRKITGLVFTHTDITALKKTERELKRSNEQLLALNEISTLISTSLDLHEIIQTTVPLLKKETGANAVLVYLIDPHQQDLVLAQQIGFDQIGYDSMKRLSQGQSVTGFVVKTKEALYVSEKAFLDERILPQNREALKRANLHAMAVIPLASKNKVWGALDIFYDTPYEFSAQERQLLSLVGNQLGTAIENAQLYQELRSQIDRLTVLYRVSEHLTSTLDIDQIFNAVNDNIQYVVPYETFSIELYDAWQKSTSTVFEIRTIDGRKIKNTDRSFVGVLLDDSPEDIVVTTKRSYQNPEQTSMYVPMLSKETIIGIMSVQGNPSIPYTETHLRLLESVGNLTALAIEKAKLYEETVKISLEIQRRNKELDDFTYVVSHDLKEPLISIEGFSRILQADYRDAIQAEGKEYLDSIVGATSRMKGLIDDLLMLSRVSRPSEAFKPVPLAPVIEDIRTDMEFTIKHKRVNFIVPSNLPTVYGNETQLKIVFRNLIGNAVKFNNKPKPMVEVGFRNAENNSYLFFIKDNGIGIDKEFYEKIFVIFQRLHRREEYEGTGAGLAIVKKIIETHKGKIWIESDLGKGSTFFFTIPKGFINEGSSS